MGAMITASHTISMGHRLPSYDGICSSPHGHNVKVTVDVQVAKFFDFKVLKDHLMSIIESMDHAMVLYEHDPFVRVVREFNFRYVTLNVEPSTEHLAQLIFNEMCSRLMHHGEVAVACVTVYETDKYSASVTVRNEKVRRVF